MKLLLDTNAYSDFMRGHEPVVKQIRSAELLLMSPFVIGELLYGFRNGRHFEKNRTQLDDFLSMSVVEWLPVTLSTSDRYSRIVMDLRRKGRPIPTNDIWIAAHAMESGAELLSRDRHFQEVPGLLVREF
ncbi:MAG: type II toxin-antitoxin system VapC family toxin [Thiolinea sp.]